MSKKRKDSKGRVLRTGESQRKDLDFENRKIFVGKQLIKEKGGKYHVEKTKTESGVRYIPMTDEVCESLQNIVRRRKKPKKEMIIDGTADSSCWTKTAIPR